MARKTAPTMKDAESFLLSHGIIAMGNHSRNSSGEYVEHGYTPKQAIAAAEEVAKRSRVATKMFGPLIAAAGDSRRR